MGRKWGVAQAKAREGVGLHQKQLNKAIVCNIYGKVWDLVAFWRIREQSRDLIFVENRQNLNVPRKENRRSGSNLAIFGGRVARHIHKISSLVHM